MIPLAEQEATHTNRLGIWKYLHPSLLAGLIVAGAFVVRLKLASESFLNADEALHFMAANQRSWKLTYQASLTISHPPLLIFVLHIWRVFGTSEIVLRLPSVLAGTVFCWVFFHWLSDLFGSETGLVGLMFASFLPPMIALSAEIRQYSLLLCFAICTMYFLERALAKHSAGEMLLCSICLWLAMLSQYSAVLLAAALGTYALLRMFRQRPSRAVTAVWVAGQIGALLICSILYFTYIAAFGRRAFHSWMDVYLHNSYFDPSRHNALVFVVTRSASLFQYVLGDNPIGIVMFLVFISGIVMVLRRRKPAGSVAVSDGQLATLLILPFAINCAPAFFDVYPYGGTRHCIFLAIFAIAGISFVLYTLAGRRPGCAISAAALIIVLCNLFPSHRLPYIARTDQQRAHMEQALAFIREQIPHSELLVVDNQTSLLLGHYLCQQRPFFVNEWAIGFNTLQCGGYRIAATDGRVFTFIPDNFFPSWSEMTRTYSLDPADSVWVLQAGWLWEEPAASQLKARYPEFHDLNVHSFGHNISIFRLRVGHAMPAK